MLEMQVVRLVDNQKFFRLIWWSIWFFRVVDLPCDSIESLGFPSVLDLHPKLVVLVQNLLLNSLVEDIHIIFNSVLMLVYVRQYMKLACAQLEFVQSISPAEVIYIFLEFFLLVFQAGMPLNLSLNLVDINWALVRRHEVVTRRFFSNLCRCMEIWFTWVVVVAIVDVMPLMITSFILGKVLIGHLHVLQIVPLALRQVLVLYLFQPIVLYQKLILLGLV